MTLTQSNEPDQSSSSTVSITVLSVTPAPDAAARGNRTRCPPSERQLARLVEGV
jgi:hypothetical protein